IMQHPDHAPRVEDIREEYDLGEMVRQRLDVLRDHGFIEKRGDSWHLRTKGRFFALTQRASAWIYRSKTQREKN
ncbi:MAG: hypothetical protein V2A79_07395, partial [Planctomycetota bacterium]